MLLVGNSTFYHTKVGFLLDYFDYFVTFTKIALLAFPQPCEATHRWGLSSMLGKGFRRPLSKFPKSFGESRSPPNRPLVGRRHSEELSAPETYLLHLKFTDVPNRPKRVLLLGGYLFWSGFLGTPMLHFEMLVRFPTKKDTQFQRGTTPFAC